MKTNIFSSASVILVTALLFLGGFSPLFAQQDYEREILVYFTSGIERAPQGQPARVNAPAIQAVLNRFNIGSQAVTSTFPNFDERDTLITTPDGRTIGMPNMARSFKVRVPNNIAREAVIDALKNLPMVLFAEPNGSVDFDIDPNDSYFSYQWGLKNVVNGVRQQADIKAPEAWDIFQGSSSTKIGIIDGGVDATHPDLSGKVSGHTTTYGYHGTHVAGIAAAKTNNTTGVAGVNWNAQILTKAFNDGSQNGDPYVYQIVTEAVNEGADVLNNSWKLVPTGRYSTTVRIAFAYAYKMNRAAVATIGNTGPTQNTVQYPGSFGQGIIAVGATDNIDVVADFSTRGSAIDVSAPGVSILSTYRNGITFSDPNYEYLSGTSMTAPHVSGIASLLKGYNPSLSNDDIENILKLSADDVNSATYPGWDQYLGTGRVNARRALDYLRPPYALLQRTATGATTFTPALDILNCLQTPYAYQSCRYYLVE